MEKEHKFEKVVEWGDVDDKGFLIMGIIFMIPIIGQFFWLICFKLCWDIRKVYWRKIK